MRRNSSIISTGGENLLVGTWGTGLYSNDVAEDVRDACKDIYAFLDVDSANEKIFNIFSEYVFESKADLDDDNEIASFWYALADWQWNHGILSPEIRDRTIDMLNDYAGLSEWTEPADRKKRKAVMDTLKLKLMSEQPSKKTPRVRLKKAKHNPGDIIIFKSCQVSDDIYQNLWMIKSFTWPIYFKSEKLFQSPYDDVPVHDAHGKYMALLCVGKTKVEHSVYINDLFDEYSVYVWYDYEGSEKPTVEQLQRCGFLPRLRVEYADYNSFIVDHAAWAYDFVLLSESFRSSKNHYELICIERNTDEVKRVEKAMAKKNYQKTYGMCFELFHAYLLCWQEKVRAALVGLSVDTLLNENENNPELLPVDAINNAFKTFKK